MIPRTLLVAALLAAGPSCRSPKVPAAPRRVRDPAAAGRFYPADATELDATVSRFLAAAQRTVSAPVKMVLVPHAGLEFSGAVAATSFKQLTGDFERVVILAANHNGQADYGGVSIDRATVYRMPGFEVPVASLASTLVGRPGFVDEPAAHTMHMVEIELPFLRRVADRPFAILPLVVGRLSRMEARQTAAEIARLVDGKTLVVVSVDLSHYYPYDRAVALDRACLEALQRADAEAVAACDTDGTQVLAIMNELAAHLGLTPRLLAYANSGDTAGDRSRVVGYGAMAYEDRYALGFDEGRALVGLARRAVEGQVRAGQPIDLPPDLLARWPRLGAVRAAFVTLRKNGALRGCIGSLTPSRRLVEDVIQNGASAASRDPRFPPVTPDELAALSVSVSVLELPRPLEGYAGEALLKRLAATRPGLILELNGRRSTFLPEVWEEISEPLSFLEHLCAKQGSPTTCWREVAARFQSYGSQHFAE